MKLKLLLSWGFSLFLIPFLPIVGYSANLNVKVLGDHAICCEGSLNEWIRGAFVKHFPNDRINLKTEKTKAAKSSNYDVSADMESALALAKHLLTEELELNWDIRAVDFWIFIRRFHDENKEKTLVFVYDVKFDENEKIILSTYDQSSIEAEIDSVIDVMSDRMIRRIKENIITFDFHGVSFKAIKQILAKPRVLSGAIEIASRLYRNQNIEFILAVDSRGYIFGKDLATSLNIPFVMIAKGGKLPGYVVTVEFKKEYSRETDPPEVLAMSTHLGTDKRTGEPIELRGKRVLIVDDVMATGGTARAAESLAEQLQAVVVGTFCLIEIGGLNGKAKLHSPFQSLVVE